MKMKVKGGGFKGRGIRKGRDSTGGFLDGEIESERGQKGFDSDGGKKG